MPRSLRWSRRRHARDLDSLPLVLLAAAGSLVLLLGWGVEQWRLSDQEVPVHTARLYAYP
jgi:hypothetical protein